MSGRKRLKSTSTRRGRRILTRSEDDLPLSLLAIFNAASPATRKKRAPRKRNTRSMAAPAQAVPTEVINIDDIPERAEIMNNVNTKIGNFIQSGSFISSDEDETEMVKAKIAKKSSPDLFFISDDSDDEYKKTGSGTSRINTTEPSTSAGTSRDTFKESNPKNSDDIMGFVDSVLNSNTGENKQTGLKDMKSLEDFRKETEEMLKNASSLLDEIKTGRKPEPEPKKEEASASKVTVGACPICLENLGGCPAAVTVCGHIFCKQCITQTAQTLKKCPTCRKPINLKKIHPIYF